MNFTLHNRPLDGTAGASPDETWLFAQALLGHPLPSPQSVAQPQPETAASQFAAAISSRQSTTSNFHQEAAPAGCDRDLLQWLAYFSDQHACQLRALEQAEARDLAARRRTAQFLHAYATELTEWNEADHPRAPKGTSTGGQWVRRGSGSTGNARSGFTSRGEPERVLTHIRRASGDQWSGDNVLAAMASLAPDWLPFLKKHVTLALTSAGATEPTTTVRRGEFGPAINDLPGGSIRTQGPFTIHFEIPTAWNDVQVTQYILTQIADDIDVHRVAADWAHDNPELIKSIQDQRFKSGLTTVAALASGYYTAIASLTLAGQFAVATWDIQNGDFLGAAINIACTLPIGGVVQGGIEFSGAIAIKVGDRIAGVLPTATINKVKKLAPEQLQLLSKRLLAAQDDLEVAKIVAEFLGTKFDKHHPLPKFLGGETKQLLAKMPQKIHKEFHAVLREELRAAGLNLRIGGPGGSTADWRAHLGKEAGSQWKAFNAVLSASRAMDAKHGTDLTQWVWQNLLGKHFVVIPKV